MNTLGFHSEGEGMPDAPLDQKGYIATHFEQGVGYYELLQKEMQSAVDIHPDDSFGIPSEIEILHTLAQESFKETLSHVGTEEEQLLKIRSLLFLVRLASSNETEELRQTYFYNAVEMTKQYLSPYFQHTEIGADILQLYLSVIEPRFSHLLSPEDIDFGKQKIYTLILAESDRREKLKIQRIKNIGKSFEDSHTYQETIDELEGLIGPIRLIITADESGEVILSHRFDQHDATDIESLANISREITIEIFDKERTYKVVVDRGSRESSNQLDEGYWGSVIKPIIELIIQKKEYILFLCALDNMATIELNESDLVITMNHPVAHYRTFISRVFSEKTHGVDQELSNKENDLFIDAYLKAIDICRHFTRESRADQKPSGYKLPEIIDQILGGKIDRQVLHMVQSLLLSRNETMNGTGYPYGLSKKNIPLLTRIYAIIRSYEALSHFKNPTQVISTLKEWGAGGYFDNDILRIFLEESATFGASQIVLSEAGSERHKVSRYRKNRYEIWIQRWYELLTITDQIEDSYQTVRECGNDREIQNTMFLKINKLRLSLLKAADIRKIISISRHGETPSDVEQLRPGNDQEVLNERGISTSEEKGEILEGLKLRIFSSPILRARQTAQIVCQSIKKCTHKILDPDSDTANQINNCLSCPGIILEKSIVNPTKNRDDGRYYSYGHRLFADTNRNQMIEFLTQLISAPDESMNLFITHRDSARNLIFWLENLFVQDGISGEKTPIENHQIYEFFFRGDSLVQTNEDPSKGLIFFLTHWRNILGELNLICLDVFGEAFHVSSPEEYINLIALHDLLLDFLDAKKESSPEQLTLFLDRAETNPTIKHIIPVLRAEMIVGDV